MMIYLLKGDDYQAKERKIDEIKNKILSHPDAAKFDFENLDAAKVSSEDLKKSFMAMPVIIKTRLILIRNLQKASNHNQTLLTDFINDENSSATLICDCSESSRKGFITKIAQKAKVLEFSTGTKLNVFDMTKAMSSRHPKEALKILDQLMNEGNHPLQLMGGLVWFWGNSKNRMSADRFQQGLKELQEADLNIKRSRLHPEYTLEVLVTKLSLLIT